jgi:hypothetical protein
MADIYRRLGRMEASLAAVLKDNAELLRVLRDRDQEILALRSRLNAQEQYQRSWSIRVMNLPIPNGEESDPRAVMRHVHSQVLEPLLRGAVESGLLNSVPGPEELLETAHILPAKEGTTPPIIARFYSRNTKALMFKMKRDFAAREAATPTKTRQRHQKAPKGRYVHPFYEDLTRQNFGKMRALAADPRVEAAWSVSGIIRYKMRNSEQIRRVKDVFASVNTILEKGA